MTFLIVLDLMLSNDEKQQKDKGLAQHTVEHSFLGLARKRMILSLEI